MSVCLPSHPIQVADNFQVIRYVFLQYLLKCILIFPIISKIQLVIYVIKLYYGNALDITSYAFMPNTFPTKDKYVQQLVFHLRCETLMLFLRKKWRSFNGTVPTVGPFAGNMLSSCILGTKNFKFSKSQFLQEEENTKKSSTET